MLHDFLYTLWVSAVRIGLIHFIQDNQTWL